ELPGEPKSAEVVRFLQEIAAKAGVVIEVVPGDPRALGIADAIPYKLSAGGTFKGLAIFVNAISLAPRILSWVRVSLGNPRVRQGLNLLDGELELEAYRYRAEDDRI